MLNAVMDHSRAIEIFNEIRARPYQVSTKPGLPANNCYFKGIELLRRLGTYGYAVRGIVCETYWNKNLIPAEILALESAEFMPCMHFYIEAEIEGAWRKLDTSFHPTLAQHGFRVCNWDSDDTCFEATRVYDLAESIAYQIKWEDPDRAADYFEKSRPFLKRLNEWFAGLEQ